MKQVLNDFILEWNQTHQHFTFSAQTAPMVNRPTSVEIRYPAVKYQKFLSDETWEKLCDLVEARSRNTMYVATNKHLFERGIIDVKIASQNHNFKENLIIAVLRWIGEEFFPQE